MNSLKFWTPKRTVAITISFLYIVLYLLLLLYLLFYLNSCKASLANISENTAYKTINNIDSATLRTSNKQQIKKAIPQKEAYTYYYVQPKEGLWQIALKQKIPVNQTTAWIDKVAKLNHLTVRDSNGNYKLLTNSVLKLPKTF